MTGIASLPMYDAGPGRGQALWQAIAGASGAAAEFVLPADLEAHWLDDRLVLSQACGFPYASVLRGRVQLLGAFHYDVPGCAGYFYRSFVVARADDARVWPEGFAGTTAAFNGRGSQSGFNGLRHLVAPLLREGRFFGRGIETGAHVASVAAVLAREADVAAIDCVTLALLGDLNPGFLSGLRIVAETAAAPGLPLVCALQTPDDVRRRLLEALGAVAGEPAFAAVRAPFRICGFTALERQAYDICLDMAQSPLDRALAPPA